MVRGFAPSPSDLYRPPPTATRRPPAAAGRAPARPRIQGVSTRKLSSWPPGDNAARAEIRDCPADLGVGLRPGQEGRQGQAGRLHQRPQRRAEESAISLVPTARREGPVPQQPQGLPSRGVLGEGLLPGAPELDRGRLDPGGVPSLPRTRPPATCRGPRSGDCCRTRPLLSTGSTRLRDPPQPSKGPVPSWIGAPGVWP